ncbi:MAG: DUF885 domain-containing protein [Litorimonas sp.]
MTYLRPLALTLMLLGACSPAEAPQTTPVTDAPVAAAADTAQSETERLNAWFATRFEEEVMESPEYLARLGRKDRMSEWDDESPEAYDARIERARDDLRFLETVNVDALEDDARLSLELYRQTEERRIERAQWRMHGYPFNQMFGTHSDIPTFLLNQHRIDNEDDARAFVERLRGIPGKLDPVIERSAASFDMGISPPAFVYGHLLRDIGNITSGAPYDDSGMENVVLNAFRTKMADADLPANTREALTEEAMQAMRDAVAPAYARLEAELLRQQAGAGTDDGVWKLPDGEDFYTFRLREMTTTDLTADEIHDICLREVDRIHAEMRAIMEDVRFEGDLQDFFEFMRTDEQFYYPTTDEGKARYLAEATAIIDTYKARLDEVFLRKPKADMEVRAVEAFREQSAGKAFYSRPAADGSRPGYYYANLYDMGSMPIYQMEALAYHEGIPGHHMQLAIAQELEGIPEFRKFGRYTAYSEGWGLYSEYQPKEMGFYEDPYSDFGRLAMELWRACRLVVDTGLHHKRWTREEAIDYLKDNTPNPEGDIVKAIERYIVMPGQATAYMIGKIKILELREKAREALGEDFDIREFHEVFLASGPVPLDVLERRVDAYIEAGGL